MNQFKISICIPTYNRTKSLDNCLNSILIAKKYFDFNFEVCISDNCSDLNASNIVKKYVDKFNIKFKRNLNNIGMSANILNSVSISDGEYIWLLGDDDLLLKETFKKIDKLFKINEDIDFFFVNSYHLDSKFLENFPKPFDTNNLPLNLEKFSKYNRSFKGNFFDLIDPKISHDFLLGMFLSIFKKKKWMENCEIIKKKISSELSFSNLENTGPHVIIFSKAFNKSKIFFLKDCLSINLHGIREWSNFYPLVDSFWIPEILNVHRKNGLSFTKYLICKNFSLKKLFINLFRLYFSKKYNGKEYINFKEQVLKNLYYPNIYIFPFIRILQIIVSKIITNNK